MNGNLGDYVDIILGGTPQTSIAEYWDGDIPWVTPGDMTKSKHILSTARTISESGINNSSTKLLNTGDVIISARGSVGKIIECDRPMAFNQSCYAIRTLNEKKLAQKYVYYLARDCVRYLKQNAAGAVFNAIIISTLERTPVSLPKLQEQIRIASILSIYDDLIENNRRRIQLLGQAARLLYKEWFVHLRFPGHEHVKIKNGVPEGWEKRTLGDLSVSVNYGYTASAQNKQIGPKFLRITDIVPDVIDWQSVPYCEITDKELTKFSLREGDVVVARTGATVGYAKRILDIQYPTVFASYLVRFRFNEEIDDLITGIFMESEEYKTYVLGNAGGAAQPNANAKVLSAAKILKPPKHIQSAFREYTQPLLNQKENLRHQNEVISQARDLLLPRLMNGEVAV